MQQLAPQSRVFSDGSLSTDEAVLRTCNFDGCVGCPAPPKSIYVALSVEACLLTCGGRERPSSPDTAAECARVRAKKAQSQAEKPSAVMPPEKGPYFVRSATSLPS